MMDLDLISSDPRQRDPRSCPMGLYLAHALSTGGHAGFFWFASDAEALRFLRSELFWADADLSAASVGDDDAIASCGLLEASTLTDVDLDALNDVQNGISVRWAGQFLDLLASQTRFCREVRSDFGSIVDPVADDAFVAHLAAAA